MGYLQATGSSRTTADIPVELLTPEELEEIKAEMRDQAAAAGDEPTYGIAQRHLLTRREEDIIVGEYSPWPRECDI